MNGTPPKIVRALSLFSGGLDSQLAVCVLREQGIHVEGIVFESPFFHAGPAQRAAERLRLQLHRVDFTDDILALLANPPHGFGACLNPCIDCHARMLQRAGEMMARMGFDFVSTGEVLDERPMSQHRGALAAVAQASGYADRVVRPLSARLLPPTLPEKQGWVDRGRLLALRGRSRRRQLELARHYGLTAVPQPAGGCRLTEPNFSRRLRDLQTHEGLSPARRRDLEMLRIGRHFRLPSGRKLVIGRNERDNAAIERLALPGEFLLTVRDVSGPVGLLPAEASEEDVRTAASVCARYSDAPRGASVIVTVRGAGAASAVEAAAAPEEMIDRWRV